MLSKGFVVILLPYNTIKPPRWYFRESLLEFFVILFLVVLPHWRFFISERLLLFYTSPLYLGLSGPWSFLPPLSSTPTTFNCLFLWDFLVICLSHFNVGATVFSRYFLPTGKFLFFTPHSFWCICDSDLSRNTPFKIFLYACCHRMVSSGWYMICNYWCSLYKTVVLLITLVSHEI